MKVVSIAEFRSNPDIVLQIVATLKEGGIACLPSPSGYRLMADLQSDRPVMALLQAKRRVKNAPALVLVPDPDSVARVAGEVSADARRLMGRFWPGPLTLLVAPAEGLHPGVRRAVAKATGWMGVRLADDPDTAAVVTAFGKPVLVSSANLSNRTGASSVAQVKKNFGRVIALLVDAGDVTGRVTSTLVDVTGDEVKVVRKGAVDERDIMAALVG